MKYTINELKNLDSVEEIIFNIDNKFKFIDNLLKNMTYYEYYHAEIIENINRNESELTLSLISNSDSLKDNSKPIIPACNIYLSSGFNVELDCNIIILKEEKKLINENNEISIKLVFIDAIKRSQIKYVLYIKLKDKKFIKLLNKYSN